MARPGELTTTSYALLGLLAVQPWTTYELAQQMDRAVSWFWPRARSKVYEEPKKLVAHGLARASAGATGRRPRTTYTITPKGRRALAAWLTEPGTYPQLEWEQLLKVFFAEHSTKADLLAGLEQTRQWAARRTATGDELSQAYLTGSGPYPERLPQLILVGKFLGDFTRLVDDWTAWASDVISAWPDDIRSATPDLEVLRALRSDGAESGPENLSR